MRLKTIALLLILTLVAAILAMPLTASADVVKPIYKVKAYPALEFYGDVSYAYMHFKFDVDGTVYVSDDADNELVIKPPATLVGLTDDKDSVIQDFGTWQAIYDFTRDDNEVKITYRGSHFGKIDIPMQPSELSLDSEARQGLWSYKVGQFDEDNKLVSGITYDWSDARGVMSRDSKTNTVGFEAMGAFDIDPSVVGATTHYLATGKDCQRHTFYSNGRHWVFYSDGTNYVWRTSTDGESWSSATTIVEGSDGTYWATFHDDIYVHYARWADAAIYYRRGTTNADGTIDWSAAEQTAVAVDDATDSYGVGVGVDSGGYPWVSWKDSTDGSQVSKSSTNDGTWTDAGGFPLGGFGVVCARDIFVPLTSGKMYVIYYNSGLKGILWSGSDWGDVESIDSSIRGTDFYSATSYGDVVQVAYVDANPYPVVYIERSGGGSWGAPVTIYDGVSSSSIHINLTSTSDTGDLILFWTKHPTAHHIFYKERISGVWDGSATDWIDETTDELAYGQGYPAAFFKAASGFIGVAYVTGTGSPWDVKYAFLTGVSSPTVTNSAADEITTSGADLHGEITADGGDDVTTVGFEWDTDSGEPYTNDWNDDYSEDTFTHAFTDMPPDTTIYWRAYATNGIGTGYSDELFFDTLLPLPLAPTAFTITESDLGELTITWTTGTYADTTIVRVSDDNYPVDYADGYLVYDGALETATLDGLELNYGTYYIRAWSHNDTGYSVDYAEGQNGGEMLLLVALFGAGVLVFLVAEVFHIRWLGFPAAGFLVAFGAVCYQYSTAMWDIYYILFFLGCGLALPAAIAPLKSKKDTREENIDDEDDEDMAEIRESIAESERERRLYDPLYRRGRGRR
jgi:hypothetical protein